MQMTGMNFQTHSSARLYW
ncbi:hypothetical protein AALB64_12855 [Lachnospiraceae bacterium 45-P1]